MDQYAPGAQHPAENGNRATRRAAARAEPPKQPDVHIHLQTSDRGPQLQISSFAANVILQVLNSVPMPSSSLKLQVAVAQSEIEEGLRKLASVSAPEAPAKLDS